MIEHRLIERMITLLAAALDTIKKTNAVNAGFISTGVDFFRTYADRTHHGKEEEIFFRELAMKELSAEHRKMMERLIQEHIWARQAVAKLAAANARHAGGDREALKDMMDELDKLVTFYPMHIEKEDKDFFLPVMKYFSSQEQNALLDEFWVFDRGMIHEKYKSVVEEEEERAKQP